jgi:inhibitor of cysteine peptidase
MKALSKNEGLNTKHNMSVKLGDIFKIEIEGNMTTGYLWLLAQMPSNFYLLDVTYITHGHIPVRYGEGGIHTFTFRAMKATGKEPIVFKQMRPRMRTAINTQTWNVVVEDSVSYERYENYFVNNTVVAGREELVLNNKAEFDKYFSPAVITGSEQWIEESDFKENKVATLIFPIENISREIRVENVVASGDHLEVFYGVSEREITWKAQTALILLVKGNYKDVSFIPSNDKSKK